MSAGTLPPRLTRREILKWGAVAGLAGAGAVGGFWALWNYALNLSYPRVVVLKPWEQEPGVVDYEKVLTEGWGPSELGFVHDIRDSPPEMRILAVAQWYDSWPGSVIRGFEQYMAGQWGLSGVVVRWNSNIVVSNDEILQWVLEDERALDVLFPSNYAVETLEKAWAIVNLNRAWIPNYVNVFGRIPAAWPPGFEPVRGDLTYQPEYPDAGNGYNNGLRFDLRDPSLNGYGYRMNASVYPSPRGTSHFTWDETNSLLAVPYEWYTTGIGYRTDYIDRATLEDLGWDIFEVTSYSNPTSGQTHDLTARKTMLDESREVFAAALKAVGWKRQVDAGITPTAVTRDPNPPWNGEYQWSSNELDASKIQAATAWIRSFRDSLRGFNTPQAGPWVVSGITYLAHARSGDAMYAIRPNSGSANPVDYLVPRQGSSLAVDAGVIGRSSEKLWLAHEFLNYLLRPEVGAHIAAWNLYPSPNAWSFELLHNDPSYSFRGQNPDGSPYVWNPAEDSRLYADLAYSYAGPPILNRCEYRHDLGAEAEGLYDSAWAELNP